MPMLFYWDAQWSFVHVVYCHNTNYSCCTAVVIYSTFSWHLLVIMRSGTAAIPWPRGCSGTAESLLMRRWRTSRSGAERKVSTLRGLFPFRSCSLSFSLSRNVGFLPKMCVCPAMMYKTKSWLNEMENQSQRERKKEVKERKRNIKREKYCCYFQCGIINNKNRLNLQT